MTPSTILQIMPMAGQLATVYAGPLTDAAAEFNINSPLRLAAWLAMIAHESMQLRYVREIASGHAYDHREDLGNTQPQAIQLALNNHVMPGQYWKGHGLFQITGFWNHLDCARTFDIPIEHIVEWLQTPIGASRSAGMYWHEHRLNYLADAGDIAAITHAINGGFNGLEERQDYFTKACDVLKAVLPTV